MALRILTDALNKLKAQRGRENRRAYWRDKYLKRGITRITREEADALQWLIFFESDRYEKEQESAGDPPAQDLVVRYVKNLVRMTTAMSSFHVNVGLHRLLHNYSTAETQRTYETVTERFLGADEYRRAKSVLMGKLEQRFDRFLKTLRTQHGELRFEECEDQDAWRELVEACLGVFTPWSTCQQCPVPAGFDPDNGQLLPELSETSAGQFDRDQVEMKRCHVFIDPVCYTRLAAALALDPPEKRLALPRFFMENNKNERSNRTPQPPALSGEERRGIDLQLTTQASRRKKTMAQRVKVLVDGQPRVEMDLARKTESSFIMNEGAELLEVRTGDQPQELLLATQPIPYAAEQGILASRSTIFLKGGNQLSVSFAPLTEAERVADGPRQAVVQLSYEPRAFGPYGVPANAFGQRWFAALGYSAAAAGLVALGWMLGTRSMFDHGRRSAPESFVAVPSPSQPQIAPAAPSPDVAAGLSKPPTYKLISAEWIVRGPGGPTVPSVLVPAQPTPIALELPDDVPGARKPLRAVLRSTDSPTDILTEILSLQSKPSTAAGHVFWVPSSVLKADQDYIVVLESLTASGKFEEIESYPFRTVARAK